MGLELPSELTEPLGWLGLIWPQADEEQLFKDGQVWIDFGTQLRGQVQAADSAAQPAWTQNSADSLTDFEQWWHAADGPVEGLEDNADAADLIGAGLIVLAGITLAAKVYFIAQLIILAFEVAQAIATAFVSFGATMAEVPGFVAATRVFCREALERIMAMVRREIAELFEKAAKLLDKVGVKDAARSAERLAARAPRELPTTLEGWLKAADKLEVSTPKDGAHFWSGGPPAMNKARELADASGGKTLEATRGGGWLNDAAHNPYKMLDSSGERAFTDEEAHAIWERVSTRYSQQASGTVQPVLNGTPDPGSIWLNTERRALVDNPRVGEGRILPPVRINVPKPPR